MKLEEIAKAVGRFRKRLERVKREIRTEGFRWYPYDSFSVFSVLDSMLRGERRDLLELAGAAPVLDLGCGDGGLSFLFESLGCSVVAVDNTNPNCNGTLGFQSLRAALGSAVEFRMRDLDTGLGLSGRTFGLALCLGVLYHLKNPFGFLEELARRARYCLLSTRIAQVTPRGTALAGEPLAYLLAPFETNHDASNYWIFSETGLQRLLDRTGWDICDYTTTGAQTASDPRAGDRDQRAFALLRSKLPDPWAGIDLDGGWHEMEEGSWRWTERAFGVRSKPGAALRMRFRLPEMVFDAIGPVKLRARVGEECLPECQYNSPGEHLYEQKLAAMGTDALKIRFELDKAVAPGAADRRELGVQVIFWSYEEATPQFRQPIQVLP